jgi:hypothetical protein
MMGSKKNAVEAFWTKLDKDAKLQGEFLSTPEGAVEDVVAFAAKNGFDFTEDELISQAEKAVEDLKDRYGSIGSSVMINISKLRRLKASAGIPRNLFAV